MQLTAGPASTMLSGEVNVLSKLDNDQSGCWKEIHPKMAWIILECKHIGNQPHLLLHGIDHTNVFDASFYPQKMQTAPDYIINEQQFEAILDNGM